MSLSERGRSALYLGLVEVVGDEGAVEEMLSYFPARDVEEPVTKEFHRAEMAIMRAEVQAEFAAVRAEFQDGFATLRSEMQDGLAGVRSEMQDGLAGVRSELHSEVSGLRVEMHEGFRRQTTWLIGTMIGMNALTFSALALIR